MARTRASRKKGKSRFSLKSGNTSSFKSMGSKSPYEKSPYEMSDNALPQTTEGSSEDRSVYVGLDGSPLPKSDKALLMDYEKEREKNSPYRKDDDKPEKTEVEKPEPAPKPTVREDTNENVTFENLPGKGEAEDVSIDPDDPMGGFVPGENIKGSGYEYNPKGEIVKSDQTEDIAPETDAGDSDWDSRGRGGYSNREHHYSDDPEKMDDYQKEMNLTNPKINERQIAGYNVAVPSDQFSNTRPQYTDPDTGETIFMGTQDQYGDDISIPYGGTTQSDAASIGVNKHSSKYDNDTWGGYEKNQMYGDNFIEGSLDDALDTVTGRDKVEGTILSGEDQGKNMKLVEGRGADGRLMYKKVVKDGPLGLKREKEIHKRTNRKGLQINPETGKVELSKNAIVSTRSVIDPETGRLKKTKYVDGRELTPEYRKEIKEAKKDYRSDKREKKKQEKNEKKRIHNKTKHVYEGMNASQAEWTRGEHQKAARESGMSYEAYMEKNFAPPPKDNSILAGGPFGTKEERQQRKQDRKERERYDDYYASNEPY